MLMFDSNLPCFKPDSLKNLESRFVLNKNDFEAANYILDLINHANDNVNTNLYDDI